MVQNKVHLYTFNVFHHFYKVSVQGGGQWGAGNLYAFLFNSMDNIAFLNGVYCCS